MKPSECSEAVYQARKLCQENSSNLLYLCVFGSHLYGTDTRNSDLDFKGIFLPSEESCVLGKPAKSINVSTGNAVGKNTKDDVDIQMWSLQYFLELVSKGETNALDLLYSHTYPKMILFETQIMRTLFDNHQKLYNIKDCNAYVGYAIGQAKKYGIKGSRLGVLKNIKEWLDGYFAGVSAWKIETVIEEAERVKLSKIIPEICTAYREPSYCFQKEINGIQSIVILGKVHLGTITIGEFRARIFRDYKEYGARAEAARNSEGIDWKALSHACRALCQMKLLINQGRIQYPLFDQIFLKKIKAGHLPFERIETMISRDIEMIKKALEERDFSDRLSRDKEFIRNTILSAYGLKGGQ